MNQATVSINGGPPIPVQSMSFNPGSSNVFPTYRGEPDSSRTTIAIAEGVLELVQQKYDYIRLHSQARHYPAYELRATLNRPAKVPVETFYHRDRIHPQTRYEYLPCQTHHLLLGELVFYGEALVFLTHLYEASQSCQDPAPYSFEGVLEYCNPAMLEQLWTVLDTVILAHYEDPDHPCIPIQQMRQLGNIQCTQRVGSLAWDGQWKIIQS